jgi:AraC-like DNA-binding protein
MGVNGQWVDLAATAGFDAKELALLCHVSTRQMQRVFRRDFGMSPQQWLNNQRILAAQKLLRAGEPAKKVASDLGFKQLSHFYRQFKSSTGMTPGQFVFDETEPCRWEIIDVARG